MKIWTKYKYLILGLTVGFFLGFERELFAYLLGIPLALFSIINILLENYNDRQNTPTNRDSS